MSASRVLAVARPPTRGSGASLAPELVWHHMAIQRAHAGLVAREHACMMVSTDAVAPPSDQDDRAAPRSAHHPGAPAPLARART